jgi:hypothetical protein
VLGRGIGEEEPADERRAANEQKEPCKSHSAERHTLPLSEFRGAPDFALKNCKFYLELRNYT